MKVYMVYTECSDSYYADINPKAYFKKKQDAEEFIFANWENYPYEEFNILLSYGWEINEAIKDCELHDTDVSMDMKIKEVEVFE